MMEKKITKNFGMIFYPKRNIFSNCLFINEFALEFLTRTFNECTVECQVSAISQIETSSRPLSHENGHKLAFISYNGSHPLVAMDVVEEALNLHFKGKPRHFLYLTQNTIHLKLLTLFSKRLKICLIYWPELFHSKL